MEQRILVRSDDKKADFVPNLTCMPVQRKLAPKTQDQTAFDDVRVQYSLNDADFQSYPAIIQRKQIVPLAVRLQQFDADVSTEITAEEDAKKFKDLLENYDAIDNVRETTLEQLLCLQDMIGIVVKLGGDKAHRAKKILGDEYFFVCKQKYDPPSDQNEQSEQNKDPWKHMDDSPFIWSLQFLAEKFGVLKPAGVQFSAEELIRYMSESHFVGLVSGQRVCNFDYSTIDALQVRVQNCIQNEGVLVHYSHRGDISILHSTDYLKANNLLARDAEATTKATENQIVTKSQKFDTEVLKNTGFVFMFLEHKNAQPRYSRFGKYRYCVPLNSYGRGLLTQGWVILHDLGSLFKHSEEHNQIHNVRRNISISSDDVHEMYVNLIKNNPDLQNEQDPISEDVNEMYVRLIEKTPDLQNKQDPRINILRQTINKFLSTGWYSTSFKSQNEKVVLASELSDHYFMGERIIPGIAWRIALELYGLSQFNKAEYEQVTASNDSLWKYISNVIFDMQIMIPVSVMPESVQ